MIVAGLVEILEHLGTLLSHSAYLHLRVTFEIWHNVINILKILLVSTRIVMNQRSRMVQKINHRCHRCAEYFKICHVTHLQHESLLVFLSIQYAAIIALERSELVVLPPLQV